LVSLVGDDDVDGDSRAGVLGEEGVGEDPAHEAADGLVEDALGGLVADYSVAGDGAEADEGLEGYDCWILLVH
jgi:hypothetical protein